MATELHLLNRIRKHANGLPEITYRPDIIAKIKKGSELIPMREKDFQYRPDVLSMTRYGTSRYWNLLLIINGFKSVLDFHTFGSLYLPKLSTLEKYVIIP